MYHHVRQLYRLCAKEINKASPSSHRANTACGLLQKSISESGGINRINVQTGSEPDYTSLIHYLNNPNVRKALHVDRRIGAFSLSSKPVAVAFARGEQDSAAHLFSLLLAAQVRVLVYNGLDDGSDSNFMGTNKWLAALDWSGKRKFAQVKTCLWHVNNQVVGYSRTALGLTQVTIRGAGHMAPTDKPEELLSMLKIFISAGRFCD